MSNELGPIGATLSVVASYVSHNAISASELPRLIRDVHEAIAALGQPQAAPVAATPLVPAVPVRKSITPDAIICLEDGKSFQSLKRHLLASYGMTPDQYRAKWGLPADYPMVALNYSAKRSQLAKNAGLGRKRGWGKAA